MTQLEEIKKAEDKPWTAGLASSFLDLMIYIPKAESLTLIMKSGAYHYSGIGKDIAEGLRDSPSPGEYYNAYIKNRFYSGRKMLVDNAAEDKMEEDEAKRKKSREELRRTLEYLGGVIRKHFKGNSEFTKNLIKDAAFRQKMADEIFRRTEYGRVINNMRSLERGVTLSNISNLAGLANKYLPGARGVLSAPLSVIQNARSIQNNVSRLSMMTSNDILKTNTSNMIRAASEMAALVGGAKAGRAVYSSAKLVNTLSTFAEGKLGKHIISNIESRLPSGSLSMLKTTSSMAGRFVGRALMPAAAIYSLFQIGKSIVQSVSSIAKTFNIGQTRAPITSTGGGVTATTAPGSSTPISSAASSSSSAASSASSASGGGGDKK